MTMEAYVEKVLAENPDFVEQMNKRVDEDYADAIKEAQNEFAQRMEKAKEAWTKNRGEEAFAENFAEIEASVKSKIHRWSYIKRIELSGDTFEAEVDLLTGKWTIAPV